MEKIYYYEGNYKYQLALDYKHQLPFKLGVNYLQKALDLVVINHPYFNVTASGLLTIKAGYAWDGPSGPTFDADEGMRASLVHDVGYQMIGAKLISMDYRVNFDDEFLSILIEDGMFELRARAWYKAVRIFGHGPAERGNKPIKCAPVPPQYPKQQKFGMADV